MGLFGYVKHISGDDTWIREDIYRETISMMEYRKQSMKSRPRTIVDYVLDGMKVIEEE